VAVGGSVLTKEKRQEIEDEYGECECAAMGGRNRPCDYCAALMDAEWEQEEEENVPVTDDAPTTRKPLRVS
jgi:hypothetical protein